MSTKTVEEYKCLNCGAPLSFTPESQGWDCEYCFSSYSKEDLDSQFNIEEPDEEAEVIEFDSYNCNSCGAELLTDDTTSATECLYCKNPAIIKGRFAGKYKPKKLIPFVITETEAKDIYQDWIKKKFFVPNDFKNKSRIDEIRGVYAPFWLFNCNVDGTVKGNGTKVSRWSDDNYDYVKTDTYQVVRTGKAHYSQIPVDASKKLDDELMQMIEPFDYSGFADFSIQYITGFMAEKYDKEPTEAQAIMEERVKEYMETSLKNDINGYNNFSLTHSYGDIKNVAESYSLLPVYVLMQKYNDEDVAFVINGQTGKVVGHTPLDKVKMLAFGGIIFVLAWVLSVFGGAFFV